MPTPTRFRAALAAMTSFSDDVFRLDFRVEDRYTRFKPGQFLHLTLEDFDPAQGYWPESRVFSICSPPNTQTVSIIFSVKGAYTSRMRDELQVGREYWLKLPYGHFIIDQLVSAGEGVVLIAGGTGISPFVAFLEQQLQGAFNRAIYLAYGVRSPDRIAFESLLERTGASGKIRQRIWSEAHPAGNTLIADHGVLDLDAIMADVTSFGSPHFLLSGPPAMLEGFSRRLKLDHGIEDDRVHIDEWE